MAAFDDRKPKPETSGYFDEIRAAVDEAKASKDPSLIASYWATVASTADGHWINSEKPEPGEPLHQRWVETHRTALVLQWTGGDLVFAHVGQAFLSGDEWLQRLGLRIGREMRDIRPEQIDLLRSQIAKFAGRDHPEDLRLEAIAAAGFVWDDKAFQPLYEMINDQDPDVRHEIAWAIKCRSEQAVDALSQLSQDTETKVRDIATFQMAEQTDLNCAKLRKALQDRLDDTDDETRWEAILGLARRKDQSAVPAIFRELESGQLGGLVARAAGLLAKPEFIPCLEGYADGGDEDFCRSIDWAIARCHGQDVPDEFESTTFVEAVKDEVPPS